MKTCVLLFLALVVIAIFPGCNSNSNTQRGATTGAVAGAVIGGIIGHQSGETGAGAAIGAAAGGLAGGAYGRNQDNSSTPSTVGRDSYGYTSSDYLSALTPDERATLRARVGSGGTNDLASLLTSQEKANLRNRSSSQKEIGR